MGNEAERGEETSIKGICMPYVLLVVGPVISGSSTGI